MKIAAIESSGLVASVAIWADDVMLAEYSVDYKKTHSQTLLAMLDEIVRMTELDKKDLDVIAISSGPGSFTGLRIGSATAKGLGFALDIPLVEVPTLEAMAYQLYGFDGLICPMMDARRGQVYTGLYTFGADLEFETVVRHCALPAADILEKINENGNRVIFQGEGAAVNRKLIEESMKVPFFFAPAHASRQRSGALAALAAEYYKKGRTVTADAHSPEYLRLSQAERERLERESCGDHRGNK